MAQGAYRVQCIAQRDSGVAEDVAVIDTAWYHVSGTTRADFAGEGAVTDALAGLNAADAGALDALADAHEVLLNNYADYEGDVLTWSALKITRFDGGRPTPNTPVLERAINYPGQQPSTAPPQVAATVSFVTALRRHWGRFYVPCIARGNIGDNGRLGTAVVDGLADLVSSMYDAVDDDDWYPVVFAAGQIDTSGAHTVTEVRCDDVFDVQRRRRYDVALYRKVNSVP